MMWILSLAELKSIPRRLEACISAAAFQLLRLKPQCQLHQLSSCIQASTGDTITVHAYEISQFALFKDVVFTVQYFIGLKELPTVPERSQGTIRACTRHRLLEQSLPQRQCGFRLLHITR
jgi:hypothetical protein